jgi:hypothetical protein
MEIMTQQAIVVADEQVRSLLMVQGTLVETELGNDIIVNAKKIPHVTVRDLEFQTTLRFLYGVGFHHVNECVLGIGSPMRFVSFTEGILQGPRTMHFKNIAELYLDDLEIGHLQLIGMKCLSKLWIRRCKRLLRPVILEDMMALEDIKMLDCEYLDDDCGALGIQKCTQLRKVTVIECGKPRPIFVSKVGSSRDFQNFCIEDIEEISDVQVLTSPWPGIEWCHNMHVKVNIRWCDNMHVKVNTRRRDDGLNVHSCGGKIGFFELYIMGAVPAFDSDVMDILTDHNGSIGTTNDTGQLRCWTWIVLQSTSALPGDFINSFDAILGRSFVPNIALRFWKQEFETTICLFHGVLYEQVLQYLPDNWSPIRIVSFTGDKFQILNQGYVSLQLGRITELCLNGKEINYKILSNLEFLIRLDIRNVTSRPIRLGTLRSLEYVKLVNVVYEDSASVRLLWFSRAPAIWAENCPRLREVVLDKCFNVCYVFAARRDVFAWGNCSERFCNLQKLLIKDCPDLKFIHRCISREHFSKLKEVEVINCPGWDYSTAVKHMLYDRIECSPERI